MIGAVFSCRTSLLRDFPNRKETVHRSSELPSRTSVDLYVSRSVRPGSQPYGGGRGRSRRDYRAKFRLADVRVSGSGAAVRSRGVDGGAREGRSRGILECRQDEMVAEIRIFGVVYQRFDFQKVRRGFGRNGNVHYLGSFGILRNGVIPGDEARDVRIGDVVDVRETHLLSRGSAGTHARLKVFHVVEQPVP